MKNQKWLYWIEDCMFWIEFVLVIILAILVLFCGYAPVMILTILCELEFITEARYKSLCTKWINWWNKRIDPEQEFMTMWNELNNYK